MRTYLCTCEDQNLKLEMTNSHLDLIMNICDDDPVRLPMIIFESLDLFAQMLLKNFSESEQSLLSATCSTENFTEGEVQYRNKFLAALKENYGYYFGDTLFLGNNMLSGLAQPSDLLSLVYLEISQILVSSQRIKDTVYLKNIFERYHICLESNLKGNELELDGTIDDLELPVRAYCALRRAGIYSIHDLARMSSEKLYSIRNMGRKAGETTLRALDSYVQCKLEGNERYIELSINGNAIQYKFYNSGLKNIAELVFQIICESVSKMNKNLFDSTFSFGLMDILLQKGYLFISDVLADIDDLSQQFLNLGLSEYYYELKLLECNDYVEIKIIS